MDTFVFFSVQMTHANRVAEWGEKSFGFRSLSFSAWQLEISPFFSNRFWFFFLYFIFWILKERKEEDKVIDRDYVAICHGACFQTCAQSFFLKINSLSVLSSLSSRRRRHCLISWRAAKKSKMKLFVYPSKSWKTCWMPFCIFKFSFFFFFLIIIIHLINEKLVFGWEGLIIFRIAMDCHPSYQTLQRRRRGSYVFHRKLEEFQS